MNLEELNNEYMRLKRDLEEASKDIEKYSTDLKGLEKKRKVKEAKKTLAEDAGNKKEKIEAENEIKEILNEISKIEEKAIKKKNEIKELEEKINNRIKEIKENPEMRKHLDEVMSKKYNRKISKLENEKAETIKKKDKLITLNELVTKHDVLGNNLKGILSSTKEIKDLKSELEGMKKNGKKGIIYKNPARANDIINNLIPKLEDKLNKNKASLMKYISENKINITEQDINEFSNNNFIVDKTGKIDLKVTIKKSFDSLNRQIKGYDKSISDYNMSLQNIDRNSIQINNENSTQPQNITSEDKPKWYQFVKKFKNWNERRKQQALPAPENNLDPSNKQQNNGERNEFINSLQYKVIKDIVVEKEKEDLKVAKKERQSKGSER